MLHQNLTEEKDQAQLTVLPARKPNPYYSNQNITPSYIILHCSGYHDPEQIWIDYQVSTHYFIPEQNDTKQLIAYEVVKMPLRAWHAGVSHWQNKTGFNDFAIGIEIHMPNYAHALDGNGTLDFKYFEPYQRAQIRALILLIQELQKKYSIPAENVIGHSDIAPWRQQGNEIVLGKTDPGPTLPWKELAEQGIGQWVDERIDCPPNIDLSAETAQYYLAKIGYAVEHTGLFDMKTNFTIGAFREHFMPECYNATSGSAEECYVQPFDASTACAMYRVVETQQRLSSKSVHSSSSSFFWAAGIAATGGTILLACLAYYLARKCKGYSQRDAYEEIPELSDQAGEVELGGKKNA
ncbi:MAG: N-acetylmuramoyl-L-alanine amidase [Gammaproteobacteria bacterium]|jgi:N-acetylmuramoyl-L-alanine amidase|nr:N-acetylmuramoyl-L-alanine amidase [Gammaproteobacteria bacterium]